MKNPNGPSSAAPGVLARVAKLRNRRSRVLDAFIGGDIDRAEKDRRLALIQGELTAAEEELAKGHRLWMCEHYGL